MFLAASERVDCTLALGCIAHGAYQKFSIDLVLDQIILCAFAKGSDSQDFVGKTSENNDRHGRRLQSRARERLQASGVREREVQEYYIEAAASEAIESPGKRFHAFQPDR